MTYDQFYADNLGFQHSAKENWELLQRRIEAVASRSGPIVGDFVRFPGEDKPRRFTHDWKDGGIQTTCANSNGDFYLSVDGFCDYSGSLDPCIPVDKLRDTGETKEGRVWFFSRELAGAHRGVYAFVPFRVYEYAKATEVQP